MIEKVFDLFKEYIKIELVLCIFFLLVPFLLPLTSGVLLPSISAYAYATNSQVFALSLGFISYLTITDGFLDKDRWYNIPLGILLALVIMFPVGEFRLIHDAVAILFFIGNVYIITYHSNLISRLAKQIAFTIIVITVLLFFLGVLTLFIAESIGFLLMSVFMLIRYLKT